MARTYRQAIAANIRAERARLGIDQGIFSDRMQTLGYDWSRGNMSHVEGGRKIIQAGDMLAIAISLETTVAALMGGPAEGPDVDLGAGRVISAVSVRNLAYGMPDFAVVWGGPDRDDLSISRPASAAARRAWDQTH